MKMDSQSSALFYVRLSLLDYSSKALSLPGEISSATSRCTHHQQTLFSIGSISHCPLPFPHIGLKINSPAMSRCNAMSHSWDSSRGPGQYLRSGQHNKECKNMNALSPCDFPVCPICHSASHGFSTIARDPNAGWETPCVPSCIAAHSECISHIAVETSIP